MHVTRRQVVGSLGGSALFVSRADAQVTPDLVRFGPELEPIVSRIENCAREQTAQLAAELFRSGVTYRQLLAALFLAGVRNVNPRPPGFALHCVFVIHAAHTLGLEAPADVRTLPLFYALDDFKSSQQRDLKAQVGDYTMRAITGTLPAPERAAAELAAAMEAWDADRAERAVVALARHRSPNDVFELLWRYSVRDYRNIGHKAIFAANACRTLHTIGWRHAEPVLRSLVLGLIDFGPEREINGFAYENQCWGYNQPLAKKTFPRLSANWIDGGAASEPTRFALEAIRAEAPASACTTIAARFAEGKLNAASCWDAVHLAAAELRMRATGPNVIGGIHAVSAANGLHYAFQAANDPELRLLILLQAAGWMAQFRQWMESRDNATRKFSILDIEPGPAERALEEAMAAIPARLDDAATRAFRLAADHDSRRAFVAASLRNTLAKANEVHYLKYAASLIEDVALVSAEWQPHLLAAMVYYAKGLADAEPEWARRARAV